MGETPQSICWEKYETYQDLLQHFKPEELKHMLQNLGLKCGGSPIDRAKRLFLTKDTPMDQLPSKIMKKSNSDKQLTKQDLAKLEAVVSALLHQLRPILESTTRRAE